MKKRTRSMVFLGFFLMFFITAPAVVLYTAGYRLNVKTGRVVQTGVLSVGSSPRGASVSLDGEPLRVTTPALVKNVFPGTHEITVSKDGHSSWSKELEVRSRETTFADHVVLFPNAAPAPVRELSAEEADGADIQASTGRVAFGEISGPWAEIWVYDPGTGAESLVARTSLSPGMRVALSWVGGGPELAIRSTSAGGQSSLRVLNVDTGDSADVSTAGNVVVSTLEDRVAVSRRDGETHVILAYLPLGEYTAHDAPDGLILLEDAARGRVTLIRAAGGDQPILLQAVAASWQWEPDGRRFLYSDGFDLRVYDPDAHADETVTRVSEPITGIAWYPGFPMIFYAQSSSIRAVELDARGRRNVTELATGSGFGAIGVHGDAITFVGTIEKATAVFDRSLVQ